MKWFDVIIWLAFTYISFMKPFKEFKWSNAWKGSPDTYNTINLNLAAALILIAIFLGLNIAIFLKERKQAEQREQYFKEFE